MAKVFHLTLMLETGDDAPEPEEWDWPGMLTSVTGLQGFSIVDIEQRPYPCMEDDPCNHTKH